MYELIELLLSCGEDNLLTEDDLDTLRYVFADEVGKPGFDLNLTDLRGMAAEAKEDGHPELARQLATFAEDCSRSLRAEHQTQLEKSGRAAASEFYRFAQTHAPPSLVGLSPSTFGGGIPLRFRRI